MAINNLQLLKSVQILEHPNGQSAQAIVIQFQIREVIQSRKRMFVYIGYLVETEYSMDLRKIL